MTATITTDVDPAYRRIGVTLDGWSADGDVVVYREHSDGSLHQVRGLDRVSGGQGFAWDYEAPFGVPVSYTAFDGSTSVVSRGPVTRTNLAVNPVTDAGAIATGIAASRGTLTVGTGYLRLTVTDATLGAMSQRFNPTNTTYYAPAAPGDVVTVSADVRSNTGSRMGIFIIYVDASFNVLANNSTPPWVNTNSGTFVRASYTSPPAPANTAKVIWYVGTENAGGTVALGEWMDMRHLLIEKASSAGPYFDGNSPDAAETVYEWTAGVGTSTSVERERYATLDIDDAWLKAPGLPALDSLLLVVEKPTVTRRRSQVVLRPIGRANPVVQADARTSSEFTLRVRTKSDDEAADLFACVDQAATCLLLVPGTRTAWQYVAIGDVVEVPFVDFREEEPGDVGSWAEWDLSCIVVDSPPGGIFGDPTASYQVVLDTFATYQAVIDAKTTYLDLLRGVV